MVKMILDEYATNDDLWNNKLNRAMDMAIDSGNPQIVAMLIQHPHWENFLTAEQYCETGKRSTPMRRLIKEMPEMARLVMDKCWKSDGKQLIAHFELVDDMYPRELEDASLCSRYDDDTRTYSDNRQPYSPLKTIVKRNHPMKIIADTNATSLMDHPLIKILVQRKWTLAVTVYVLFLLYYMIYIGLFTAFMIMSTPPFGALPCNNSPSIDNSSSIEFEATQPSCSAIQVATYIFAGLGLVMELVQLFLTKRDYMAFHNLLDWATYIVPIILLSNTSACGELTDWQWQWGVACLFVSYMNMIFFLRMIPLLGIYVMMVALMLKNFMNFFLIMFLFLLGFGICFHLLVQNQTGFSTTRYSVMKSCIMMLGELDFAGIFLEHIDNDEPSAQLHYLDLMWILYIAFLIFMSLVIMNLLTSLAVSGVDTLQMNSKYKILAHQINLALDVEFAVPKLLHDYFECCVRFQKFKLPPAKHSCVSLITSQLRKVLFGSLSQNDIIKQAQSILDHHNTLNDEMEIQKVLTVKDVDDCIVRKTSVIRNKIQEIEKAVDNLRINMDSKQETCFVEADSDSKEETSSGNESDQSVETEKSEKSVTDSLLSE